jgi:hypothetical protein
MGDTGATDFHGFRLRLGLLQTRQQALLALQNFARFLRMHRQSGDLEAEIGRNLRREGLAGAIEIILQHEARELGGLTSELEQATLERRSAAAVFC